MAVRSFSSLFFHKVHINLNTTCARFAKAHSLTDDNYEFIKVSKVGTKSNVGLVTLSRPKSLNTLRIGVMVEILKALKKFDSDKLIGALVIIGNEKAFSAGIDIKEMANVTYEEEFIKIKKPIIAAVNGYALGGRCELAMMCDIIYAGEQAKFSQPEILIGAIPGAGGTQRLTRSIGKYKAMEIVLTRNQITSQEAEKMGLVTKVFPPEKLLGESIKLAEKIASKSSIVVAVAEKCINTALESTLSEGLDFEKKAFLGIFGGKDREEGIAAFIEKRPPKFLNE